MQLKSQIDALSCFHQIDFGHGLITPGYIRLSKIPDVGTHYVVLAYEVQTLSPHIRLDDQHSALEWPNDDEILRRADIHEHVKAYFRA